VTLRGRTSTVLLDLDDTLFDHTHSSVAGLEVLQRTYAALAKFTPEQLAKIHSSNLERIHLRVLAGELSLTAARAARFRALCTDCGAMELDETELARCYREAYQLARRPVPGALELLGALRSRVKVAVVTNNIVVEQVEKLRHLGMTELIDVLVISEEAGAKKPEAAIFRIALERCGATANDAVMLGDSWESDIVGAHAAGIRAVWLNRKGLASPEPLVGAVIESLVPTDQVVDLLLGG
jgi:putative hydrolase of the HAD superfamily